MNDHSAPPIATEIVAYDPGPNHMSAFLVAAVNRERDRQEKLRESGKFVATCATTGVHEMSNDRCNTVLGEEVGEIARAVLDLNATVERDDLPMDVGAREIDIAKAHLLEEIVQTMAVLAAWHGRLIASA